MAMEPKKEQQALPEEKLLKVIQGKSGIEKSGKAASESKTAEAVTNAAARHTTVAAPVPQGVKGASSADFVSSSEKPQSTPKLSMVAKDSPTPAVKGQSFGKVAFSRSVAIPVGPSGKRTDSRITVSMVNRLLGVAACVFLALTAFEVVSAARVLRSEKSPVVMPESVALPAQDQGSTNAEPIVADIDIQIFKPVPDKGPSSTNSPMPVDGWQDFALKNMNMIGRSGEPNISSCEAIVFDKTVKKMHFLKVGQKLAIVQKDVAIDVTVESIGAEELVLTDGKRKVTLK